MQQPLFNTTKDLKYKTEVCAEAPSGPTAAFESEETVKRLHIFYSFHIDLQFGPPIFNTNK